MNRLRDAQEQIQRAILDGSDDVLALIADGAHENRDILLGVYRNAYVQRLAEVLASDHEHLKSYLGDEAFDDMARSYIAAHPSHHPNARWFGRELPAFLSTARPYSEHAQVGELAVIEDALNDAFDAPDAPILGLGDLAGVEADDWPDLVFTPHPSARRLMLATNALDIWTALSQGEAPPEPVMLATRQAVIVWRGAENPMLRALAPDEDMMWCEAAKGTRFASLCELLATCDDPSTAPQRAAAHLSGWFGTGLLTGTRRRPQSDRARMRGLNPRP